MADLKENARSYWLQGLNIIPVKAKKPLVEWKAWQTQRQTEEDFNVLPWNQADGFALIGGSQLSNGLFLGAVDFDVKNTSQEAQEKGRKALKHIRITKTERTPSGGEHRVYCSKEKPRTIPTYLGQCALELLGENKLIVMAPSKGYRRLNDNTPSTVLDLEDLFYAAIQSVGIRVEKANLKEKRVSQPLELPSSFKPLPRKKEEKYVRLLTRYWKRGYRNKLELSFLGYCLKEGISKNSATRIIEQVVKRTRDEEAEAAFAS